MAFPQLPPAIGASVALQSQNTAASTNGLFGATEYDRGGLVDAANNRFVAVVRGLYQVTAWQGGVFANTGIRFAINAAAVTVAVNTAGADPAFPTFGCGVSACVLLNPADVVIFPLLFAAAAASGAGRASIQLTERF